MKGSLRKLGKAMFGRYLLLTNTVSCGGLLGVGDVATQSLERWAGKKEKHDWARTGENWFEMICHKFCKSTWPSG